MNKDLRFGNSEEERIHKDLEKVFGSLLCTKDKYGRYHEFDKYNDDIYIEIKSRRIKHDQYDSLFFGENKFKKGKKLMSENPELKIFYVWNCLDGLYGWEHDSTPYQVETRGRCDRGKNEFDRCIDINVENIKHISELIIP